MDKRDERIYLFVRNGMSLQDAEKRVDAEYKKIRLENLQHKLENTFGYLEDIKEVLGLSNAICKNCSNGTCTCGKCSECGKIECQCNKCTQCGKTNCECK